MQEKAESCFCCSKRTRTRGEKRMRTLCNQQRAPRGGVREEGVEEEATGEETELSRGRRKGERSS